jgi:hypothetical protein
MTFRLSPWKRPGAFPPSLEGQEYTAQMAQTLGKPVT